MDKLCNINGRKNLRINIGGTIFMCHTDVLKSFPESFLATLDKQMPNHENNEYFFDRNPYIFAFILDGFRKGSIHVPKDICGTTFKEELEFWEVSKSSVAPCCWEALYKSDEDRSTMEKLMEDFERNSNVFIMQQNNKSFRDRIWLFLDEPKSSKCALVWAGFISLLIVISTLTEAVESTSLFNLNYTESEMRTIEKVGKFLDWDNATLEQMKNMKPHPYLKMTDTMCHSIITLEFIIGFIVCPNRITYASSITRIFTVIGYISFWITLIMLYEKSVFGSEIAIKLFTVLEYLTILKMARLFYITKRIPAFGIIGFTLSYSKTELKILIFILAILVCIFGFSIHSVEYKNISNVFIGMYWALITITTVGYGDYAPVTPAGHVIAIACAVCGIIILALPIGIIASSFYTFYNYHKYCRRHFKNKLLPA